MSDFVFSHEFQQRGKGKGKKYQKKIKKNIKKKQNFLSKIIKKNDIIKIFLYKKKEKENKYFLFKLNILN